MEEIWNNCLLLLKKEIDDPKHLSLIQSLKTVFNSNGRLDLYAPNESIHSQVVANLADNIRSCLNRSGGGNLQVALTYNRKDNSGVSPTKSPIFKPQFTFKNFVSGQSNEIALEVCKQISKPVAHYQHLNICGGVGLGKTHLLHAIGNEICRGQPQQSVVYFHSEFFTSKAVTAMRERTTDKFVETIRSYDCMLFDDLQFIVGKKATENLLLNTLDYFLLNNKKFIVVSDQYPKSIKSLDPRLQSRLCSFLSATIEPPNKDHRLEILRSKAVALGLDLDDASFDYIAENVTSNVRELEGALKRIASLVQFCGLKPNIINVRQALQDIIASVVRSITPETIIETVAQYFSINSEQILSNSRIKKVADARHICVYFCKEMTRESIKDIGRILGGRDHTTVRHSYNKICNKIKQNPQFSNTINEINNLIIN